MKVTVTRIDDAFHFEGRNETGNTAHMDSSPAGGGHGLGVRPMEMVLMGMGGCSGIDILNILYKQRQNVTRFDAQLDADRRQDEEPAVFTRIRAHYVVDGDVDPEKVRRAIELSLEKYCSVSKMLEKTAEITYTFEVNGTQYQAA